MDPAQRTLLNTAVELLKTNNKDWASFCLLEHVDYLIFLCVWYTVHDAKTATV